MQPAPPLEGIRTPLQPPCRHCHPQWQRVIAPMAAAVGVVATAAVVVVVVAVAVAGWLAACPWEPSVGPSVSSESGWLMKDSCC
jgi:hypothetical protein